MQKTDAAKLIIRTIVGAGATSTSNAIIKNNVSMDDLNAFGKICVVSSSIVFGSMASKAAKEHTDTMIDEIADAFKSKPKDTTIIG